MSRKIAPRKRCIVVGPYFEIYCCQLCCIERLVTNSFLTSFHNILTYTEQRDGFNGGSKADKAVRSLSKEERKAERIAAIRSAVVYAGTLMMKNTKESMFKSSWKERYFVIASGVKWRL